MLIIINTEKKSVEVPHDFKEVYENQKKYNKMLGKETPSILSILDLNNYSVVAKQTRKVVDKTNSRVIDDFMNSVKEKDKDNYDEYLSIKNKVVKTTSKGTAVKTNFLTIKKWFYSKYPEQNPFKKQKEII